MSADAATGSGSSTTPGASSSPAPGGAPDGHGMPGGHAGETLLTGSQLTTAKAAALKAVPGGTVDRAETDSGDAAYEVHMTKSDGTQVTVKLDKRLAVKAVEDGMGK